MYRAVKVRIYPDDEQENYLAQVYMLITLNKDL
ncbi:helix-turn-helix domain-containing protein [Nostoc sp.]